MLRKLLKKKSLLFFGLVFLFITVFAIANPSLAFTPQSGSSDNTVWGGTAGTIQGQSGLGNDNPIVIAAKIINVALGFLGIISLVIIIYSGFLWMTSGGSVDKITKAKKILIGGVIGLVIIMSSFAIASFVLDAIYRATTGNNGTGGTGNLPSVGPGTPGTPGTPGGPGTYQLACSSATDGTCSPDESICDALGLPGYWTCNTTNCMCEVANTGSCYNPVDDICNYPCSAGLSCYGASGCEDNLPTTGCGAGDDSCYCCCSPSNDQCSNIHPALSCRPDTGSCTGASRGACCGCSADTECGNVAITGCGDNTCCTDRPSLLNETPVNGLSDVCTNALITLEFDQAMKISSLDDNMLIIGEFSGVCPAGTKLIDVSDPAIPLSVLGGVNYCQVSGGYKLRTEGGSYYVDFSASDILAIDTRYHIVVRGDLDLSDEIDSGILSYNGVSMNGSEISNFRTINDTSGAGGLCVIDKVVLSPSAYLFNNGTESIREDDTDVGAISFDSVKDNDKFFVARAMSNSSQVITSMAGYAWDWVLDSSMTAVVDLDTSPANIAEGQALAQVVDGITDGYSKITATIDMSAYLPLGTGNNTSDIGDGESDSSDVYVFICNNPWPPVDSATGLWEPWTPSPNNFNYSIYYCRDSAGPGTIDDLPAFDSSGIVPAPAAPILQQAYFSYEALPPTSSIVAPVAVSNATYPDGGALNITWANVSGAAGYKVYYGLSHANYTEMIEKNPDGTVITGNSTTLTGLDNSRTYYITVTAYTAEMAESEYFEEVTGVPEDTYPPQTIANFDFARIVVGTGEIELHWSEVDEAYSYLLSYGLEDGTSVGYFGAEVDLDKDTSIIIDGLTSGQDYYFALQSLDKAGNASAYSPVYSVTIN